MRELAVDIGSRSAGTDGETRGAEYIRDQLASYGYQATLQPFPFTRFVDVKSDLDVVMPNPRSVDAFTLGGSPNGTANGVLVAAGIGRIGDFPSSTKGKVALVKRGDITFTLKVQNAAAAGASAVVIYNNQPGPFTGQMNESSAIPALTISREDGQSLVDQLASLAPPALTVRVEVQTDMVADESRNVVATSSGGECTLVVGGHYDSVAAGPGANDNGSGTATVVEIARVLSAADETNGLCFVLFGAEEIGLLGSAHYVKALSASQRSSLVAMLNFDMLGVGDSWPLAGSSEILDIAGREADLLGLDHSRSTELPENLGSDHASFARAGIPSIIFNCFCDPNYHTAQDTLRFVEKDRLGEAGALGLAVINALLND